MIEVLVDLRLLLHHVLWLLLVYDLSFLGYVGVPWTLEESQYGTWPLTWERIREVEKYTIFGIPHLKTGRARKFVPLIRVNLNHPHFEFSGFWVLKKCALVIHLVIDLGTIGLEGRPGTLVLFCFLFAFLLGRDWYGHLSGCAVVCLLFVFLFCSCFWRFTLVLVEPADVLKRHYDLRPLCSAGQWDFVDSSPRIVWYPPVLYVFAGAVRFLNAWCASPDESISLEVFIWIWTLLEPSLPPHSSNWLTNFDWFSPSNSLLTNSLPLCEWRTGKHRRMEARSYDR